MDCFGVNVIETNYINKYINQTLYNRYDPNIEKEIGILFKFNIANLATKLGKTIEAQSFKL